MKTAIQKADHSQQGHFDSVWWIIHVEEEVFLRYLEALSTGHSEANSM